MRELECAKIEIEFLRGELSDTINHLENFPKLVELQRRLDKASTLAAVKQLAFEAGQFDLVRKMPKRESPYDVEDEINRPENRFSYNPKKSVSVVHYVKPSTGEQGIQRMNVDTFLKLLKRLPLDIGVNHLLPHFSPLAVRLHGDAIMICPHEKDGIVTSINACDFGEVSGGEYGYAFDTDVPYSCRSVGLSPKDAASERIPDIPVLTYSFKPLMYGVTISPKELTWNGKPICSDLELACEDCTLDRPCSHLKDFAAREIGLVVFLKHLNSFVKNT